MRNGEAKFDWRTGHEGSREATGTMAGTAFVKNMNAADQAIEEIRAVRHRISTEHGHNITKYLASLRAEENQHAAQLKRGKELLARRRAECKKYPALSGEVLVLRERFKK